MIRYFRSVVSVSVAGCEPFPTVTVVLSKAATIPSH